MKSQFHNNRHSDIYKKVITVTAIFVSNISFIQKMILTAPQLSSRSPRNCSFRAIFRPQNIFYAAEKQCSEQPDVFFSFSFIFGCELTVFSVNLDAEH